MGGFDNHGASVPRWRRRSGITRLPWERLQAAKAAFTTRRVDLADFYEAGCSATLLSGALRPRAGDLVLARVERLGQHSHVELPTGRRARLHEGDEILVAYGDRYAPDQFEAEVPMHLGPTQLVASGGVASTVLSRNDRIKRATDIVPVGLVASPQLVPCNLADFSLKAMPSEIEVPPPVLAVVGTSMNSGKTTTVEQLVKGLRAAGERVGATKVTGTGSGADYWVMVDAGASLVADFTDFGLASTYKVPLDLIEATFVALVDHLTNAGCTAIVVEVADGLYQRETAHLVASETFRSRVDGMVFAAADAMGAAGGRGRLAELGLPVRAISGVLTRSTLARQEAEAAIGLPVLTKDQLSSPGIASDLLGRPAGVVPALDLRDGQSAMAFGAG